MEGIDAFVTFSTELAKKKPASLYSTNKSRYIRYILRHEAIILTVLEGHTISRNHLGRKILEMLVELMGGGECEEMKRLTKDRQTEWIQQTCSVGNTLNE